MSGRWLVMPFELPHFDGVEVAGKRKCLLWQQTFLVVLKLCPRPPSTNTQMSQFCQILYNLTDLTDVRSITEDSKVILIVWLTQSRTWGVRLALCVFETGYSQRRFSHNLHNSVIDRISQSSILFYIICWALLHEKGYQVFKLSMIEGCLRGKSV